MFKFLDYWTIITWTLIVGFCTLVSYFGAVVHGDGAEGFVISFLWILFYVFAFPFFYISIVLNIINEISLITALLANSILYGLLIERLKYYFKMRKKSNQSI